MPSDSRRVRRRFRRSHDERLDLGTPHQHCLARRKAVAAAATGDGRHHGLTQAAVRSLGDVTDLPARRELSQPAGAAPVDNLGIGGSHSDDLAD